MKKIAIMVSMMISAFFSLNTTAQEMPVGAVVRTLNCSLNNNISMAEVVEWGRNLPRDETSAGQVFFREALNHSNNFLSRFDFQIAQYYGSWQNYIERIEHNQDGAFAQLARPSDLMTCNPNDAVVISRQLPDNDGFTADDTLMMTRYCPLQEGKTVNDAFDFVSAVAANYRAAGNNSMVQLITRSLGPVQNRTGTGVLIAEVAETPAKMAERLDLLREGENVFQDIESPFTTCNFPAMWRSHAIRRVQQ